MSPSILKLVIVFEHPEQGRLAKSEGAANPAVSKIEIDHQFAVNPLGDPSNLGDDLLVFGVLGKNCLRLLVGRRIGVLLR